MYPRRGFYDRLYDGNPIDGGGDLADVIYLLVRWLITTALNAWQS